MNKFVVLLCIFLAFNFTKSEEMTDEALEKIYGYIVSILKGMSSTEQRQCAGVFINNKDRLKPILGQIIADVKNGDSISIIISRYLTSLLVIDNIGSKCNLLSILRFIGIFDNANGIREIGNNIVNSADDILLSVGDIQNGETTDDKLIGIGRIIAIVLNFYVN